MNKAILVIDMPESCYKCPCFQFGMDNYCAIINETIYNYENEKPTNCPLEPLPEKRETVCYQGENWISVDKKMAIEAGTNALTK